MTRPGPSVSSSGVIYPGADSLSPTGFGTGTGGVRASSVGTTEITDGGIEPVDIDLPALKVNLNATYGQVWATPAASTTLTGTLAAWTVTAVDCTAGAGARSLPAANSVTAGASCCAKKADTSGNALTVNRAGSDLIFGTGSGATSKVLTLAGEAVEFVSNGVDRWTVRASDTPSGVLSATYAPLVPYAYNVNVATMATFLNAVRSTRLGTSQTKVLCAGDSTVWGAQGASQDPFSKSWPAYLATSLNPYVTAERGLAVPASAATSDTDARWGIGSGWTKSAQGFGTNSAWQRNSATASLTFTPGVASDTFDIYYIQNTGFGTMTFQVDSDTVVNQSAAGTAGVAKVTVTAAGGVSSSHVLSITGSVANMFILGVEPYVAGTKKVLVGNAGVSGTTTVNWAASSPAYASIGAINAYAPHLGIVSLGINDSSAATVKATVKTNCTAIAAAVATSGSVLFVAPPPSGTGTASADLEYQYRAAMIELATATGYGFIDTWSLFGGSWTAANARGLMYDDKHPSLTGYQLIAATITAALSRVPV